EAAGRGAEALEHYQRLRDLLDEELGLQPGPALREVQLRILRQDGVPTAAVRPRSEPSAPAPSRAEVEAETALVGRERERAQLMAARTGPGPRFVLVEGEAGIGKTHLVTAVTGAAARAGATVVWGRCHEDADAPALWPWRQALTALDPDADLPMTPGFD